MANASDTVKPNNPANATPHAKGDRKRIPMSVPRRKFEVPDIPGYHLHWIKESNIPRALAAFYEFVDYNEVPTNQLNVGMDTDSSGSTDLGSRISLVSGTANDGRPERSYLMKLKEEYWLQDRELIDGREAERLGQIFRGEKIIGSEKDNAVDQGTRYVDRERTKALFNRPRRKA